MKREPTIPRFASHLLSETPPQPPPPPPKTEERLALEALAKELGIATTREPTRIGLAEGAKPLDRSDSHLLADCHRAVRELVYDRNDHKKVTEAIDTLIKRYIPFRDFLKAMHFRGPYGFGG